MSAPLSTTGAASDSAAWQELEEVFASLSQLARTDASPENFYRKLLAETLRALSAVGGVVWLPGPDGALHPAVPINWPVRKSAADAASRDEHERLLGEAASREGVLSVPQADVAATSEELADSAERASHVLLLAAVRGWAESSTQPDISAAVRNLLAPPRAILEIVVRGDASPATYRGYEQFIAGLCEVAADYHTFAELRRLQATEAYRNQLLQLGVDVHRSLNLTETAYAVANEGRRILGCDRLNVLAGRGSRCRLLATSGVSQIECRGGTARQLESLAELVRRTGDTAHYNDGAVDALGPIADLLEQHAESSHARQVAVIALQPPLPAADDGRLDRAAGGRSPSSVRQASRFVLVAEQFDARAGGFERGRLAEVGRVCGPALYQAEAVDRLPLVWLLRPLGAAREKLAAHVTRTTFVLAVVAAAVAALVLVPADFKIEATGTLQPAVRRHVFAPRSGLVDEVFVRHGDEVVEAAPLVRLRDPALEMEIKRVHGEIETAQRQIDAVRATRTTQAIRDASPADAFRLSAEQRELDQRLANLRGERDLLDAERERLLVISPIAGRVLTWDVANLLVARPVERGEVLMAVADFTADWQLELQLADDRVGHVTAARETIQPDLRVRFRLSSDDRAQHEGRIVDVATTADVDAGQSPAARPTVRVVVALDTRALAAALRDELRPGVTARAQIDCGRRSIGYVWLHDLWDAIVGWLRF